MGERYRNIFSPYKLKTGEVLKNRIIYPNAQQSMVVGPEKWPTQKMIDETAETAYAGASLMCFGQYDKMGGGAVPNKHGGVRIGFPGFDYEDPSTWNYLAQAAQAAHFQHTKLLVKLAPAFPDGYNFWGGDADSLFPLPENADDRLRIPKQGLQDFQRRKKKLTLEEMKARIASMEMCQQVIQDIVDICRKYKRAGWDGMSFRADRFIDACTNLREDEYGGEIENRGKFQLDMYKAVKEACGDDFIIEIALMGDSQYGHDGKIPHGYTEDEFIRFVKLVEDYVDIVEVRERSGVGYQCCHWNTTLHDHPCLEYAKHLREAGYQGIIAVNGGFNDPDEMEELLKLDYIDLISTGRTFKAEPRFIQKLRSDGKEVPTPCLFCNKCHGRGPTGAPLAICAVNPKNGIVSNLPVYVKPVERLKKVAIIGGGPIGMRAACFAAERGHDVTLFEKSDRLGGKPAFYGPVYPAQWAMDRYVSWCKDEVARRGVKVVLNTDPDPDYISEEGFDAVIACTGSGEKRPPVEGADIAGVWTNQDVYEGRADIGQNVVIVGGAEVGTETAMYLASTGRNVTIITRQSVLMAKASRPHGPHVQFEIILPELGYGGIGGAWTKYDNLKPIFEAVTTRVTPNSVTYIAEDGSEKTINCDSVIVGGGYEPYTDEALRYAECTDEFYMAGDCCIHSAELLTGNADALGAASIL